MTILSTFMSAVLIVGGPAIAPLSTHKGDGWPEEGGGGHQNTELVQASDTGEVIVVAETNDDSIVLRGNHGLDLTLEVVSDEEGELTFSFKANNEYTEQVIDSQNVAYAAYRENAKMLIGARQMAQAKEKPMVEHFINLTISTLAGMIGAPIGVAVSAAISTFIAGAFSVHNSKIDSWIADRTNKGILIKSRIYPSGLSPNVQVKFSRMKCPRRNGRDTKCQTP